MAGKKQIPAAEYEKYPRHFFRDRAGRGYIVYMDGDDDNDNAPVYVKQVADHVHIDKVTLDQWSNAILNHGMSSEETY
jgi:hypothetical protein